MYKVLDKDIIKMEIVPHIALPKRGFAPTVPLTVIQLFELNVLHPIFLF